MYAYETFDWTFYLFVSAIPIGGLQNMPTLTTATQRLKDTSPGIMWPRKTLSSLMSKSVHQHNQECRVWKQNKNKSKIDIL